MQISFTILFREQISSSFFPSTAWNLILTYLKVSSLGKLSSTMNCKKVNYRVERKIKFLNIQFFQYLIFLIRQLNHLSFIFACYSCDLTFEEPSSLVVKLFFGCNLDTSNLTLGVTTTLENIVGAKVWTSLVEIGIQIDGENIFPKTFPLSSPPIFDEQPFCPPCDTCVAHGAFVGSRKSKSKIGASYDVKEVSIKDVALEI